jgi:hypothetical protein
LHFYYKKKLSEHDEVQRNENVNLNRGFSARLENLINTHNNSLILNNSNEEINTKISDGCINNEG